MVLFSLPVLLVVTNATTGLVDCDVVERPAALETPSQVEPVLRDEQQAAQGKKRGRGRGRGRGGRGRFAECVDLEEICYDLAESGEDECGVARKARRLPQQLRTARLPRQLRTPRMPRQLRAPRLRRPRRRLPLRKAGDALRTSTSPPPRPSRSARPRSLICKTARRPRTRPTDRRWSIERNAQRPASCRPRLPEGTSRHLPRSVPGGRPCVTFSTSASSQGLCGALRTWRQGLGLAVFTPKATSVTPKAT